MVLWFLPAEEFSQAWPPLFYKVIRASAAFVQSEANNGSSQLKLMSRTLEVPWHSGFSKYTWSVCEDNMVMLTVSKQWTDVIHSHWS